VPQRRGDSKVLGLGAWPLAKRHQAQARPGGAGPEDARVREFEHGLLGRGAAAPAAPLKLWSLRERVRAENTAAFIRGRLGINSFGFPKASRRCLS